MKNLFVFLLLIPLASALPQDKYFIFFRDKGPSSTLQKNNPAYQKALDLLSSHAIERREKVMNPDSIITFEDLPLYDDYINQLMNHGIKIENKLKWFNAVSAYLNDEQKQYVQSLPFVKKIAPVKIFTFKKDEDQNLALPKTVALDELNYGYSYTQLALSGIPIVHSKGITGSGVIVGILDTGFRRDHEGLANIHVLDEYDFVFHDSVTANQPEDRSDQDSHGTYVLSIIGGFKDSTLIGASYNASYILAKTEDVRSETHVEEDNYAAALEWMENIGVDVTSSSLGYNEFDTGTNYTYKDMDGKTTIVTRAAELAFTNGVVTITAAGNEGTTDWHYIIAPADGINTIAVGAVDQNNIVASFSSQGPTYDGRIKPDVVAMGVNVFGASTNGTNIFSSASGTSAATPIAGGVAALLLSAYPHLNNEQVREIFQETSDNSSDPDNDRGFGLLSAARAISFPNLKFTNENYTLYKAFIDSFSVSDVQLHYSTDNMNYDTLNMNAEESYKFFRELPVFPLNQLVNFYFTYNDETGNSRRNPEINNYKFKYGFLTVSLNLALHDIPTNYVLSNNYPNPFNSLTKINFVATGNLPAQIIIYDALGRKVKTLFNGISKIGVNTVAWDGTTDGRYNAASGIYICVLNLDGNFYTNKMVYLK